MLTYVPNSFGMDSPPKQAKRTHTAIYQGSCSIVFCKGLAVRSYHKAPKPRMTSCQKVQCLVLRRITFVHETKMIFECFPTFLVTLSNQGLCFYQHSSTLVVTTLRAASELTHHGRDLYAGMSIGYRARWVWFLFQDCAKAICDSQPSSSTGQYRNC